MEEPFEGIEPMIRESKIDVPYSWWAGNTASRFLLALRDRQQITATRCGACGRVALPPRKECPACSTESAEWVDLSGQGTLLAFTVARRGRASIPADRPLPVIWGLVQLDGADTGLLAFLGEVAPEAVRIGMRVEAVFAAERRGSIRDISHFRPL